MSNQTRIALRAVLLRHTVGNYAARRYAESHGVLGLYRLALQLSATTSQGE